MASHAGWDVGQVFSSNQLLATDPDAADMGADMEDQLPNTELHKRFREFVRTFRSGNNYIYRDQLLRHFRKGVHNLEIDLAHINHFDSRMHDSIQKYPNQAFPVLEDATKEALAGLTLNQQDDVPDMQVLLRSEQRATSMRNLNSSDVNRLILIPGIITSATRSRPRARTLCVKCRACGDVRFIKSSGPFSSFIVPQRCQANGGAAAQGDGVNDILGGAADCGQDPYLVVPEKCTYIDQQTLKLQEAPEEVPTGEMPRNVLLSAERFLVDNASPGTRVAVMGVYSIFNSKGMNKSVGATNVRQPYIRIVGLRVLQDGSGRSNASFTPEEEEKFAALARDPNIYERMWNSVCPSVSGDYTIDIKKAVCCLLFGGSRRILPDGMKLRGDINILLLGDPSTAKSQFLKFVEKVAPVGVYTSGKGSSAAGLTASVIRDAKGEFYLEGGAMVLADGGVCCIDEFDKMREQDRVAIHEAMEQQTISVAKAGKS
jgi:DNA replication licensing factor MCM5